MDTVTSVTSRSVQYEIGDQKARDEKLNISDLPHNIGFFANDIGYITNAVNDLKNYYLKSQTYSKEQIDSLIAPKLLIKIVDSLPTSEISTSTIYFLKRGNLPGTTEYKSDVYDEYIYAGGAWELIGNTYVDLTDYYRKAETDKQIDTKVDSERQKRELADNTLQNNINVVQTNLDNTNKNLSSEIATRQSKNLEHETSIIKNADNLSAETTRAKNAEQTLSNRCDTYDSHVANISNPHGVTKAQVGLGNVTNVATVSTVTKDSVNNVTSGAVYTQLATKVDKISGKGLSDQNFTLVEKNKLANIESTYATKAEDKAKLPLAGGTMTGDIAFSSTGTTGTSKKIIFSGSTDGAQIFYNVPTSDQGNLVLNMVDDNNTYIQFAKNGTVGSYISPADGVYHGKATSASSADTATKATQDGNGRNIVSTYATKTDIANSIAGVTQIKYSVVDSLPAIGTNGTIYFVKNSSASTNDSYTEYVYVNKAWEKVGVTTVDLSGYVKSSSLATVATSGSYTDLKNKPTIPAGVVVDSATSSTSTNPLQNKVVTTQLGTKQSKITVTDSSNALSDSSTISTFNASGANPTAVTRFTLSTLWTYISSKITSSGNAKKVNGLEFEVV